MLTWENYRGKINGGENKKGLKKGYKFREVGVYCTLKKRSLAL